jgi:hypothetical protein
MSEEYTLRRKTDSNARGRCTSYSTARSRGSYWVHGMITAFIASRRSNVSWAAVASFREKRSVTSAAKTDGVSPHEAYRVRPVMKSGCFPDGSPRTRLTGFNQ